MQISEISEKVNKIAHNWEEFKSVNNRKLEEIAKKGKNDPLLDQQLFRISNDLDEQKSRLDNFQSMLESPILGESRFSNNDHEYKQAFTDYIRKGNDSNLINLEAKSFLSSNDPDGGYLIRENVSTNIIKNIETNVVMRNICSVQKISTDSLDILQENENLSSGWVQETQAREDTKTAKLARNRIQVHEMYAQPKATQKLIDDSSIDIEKWLEEQLIESFSLLEGESFIHGDGIAKPKGILSYEDGINNDQIEQLKSDNISADNLMQMYFSLNQKYANNASFLMNRLTLSKVRAIKCENTGQYLWNPALGKNSVDTLLGLPVYLDSYMPLIEKNNIAVALADFKTAYKIVDRAGIRVLRDPFTHKPFIKFYTTKRVGGAVVNSRAIKLLKII
jgi:HK97 family phage major capsid protein